MDEYHRLSPDKRWSCACNITLLIGDLRCDSNERLNYYSLFVAQQLNVLIFTEYVSLADFLPMHEQVTEAIMVLCTIVATVFLLR
jgi:hypothetical protein